MDIQIDCGSIFWGLKALKNSETSINSFNSAMSGMTLSLELTTASLLYEAQKKVSQIVTTDLPEVIERLEESKKILEENDQESAYLFSYYEQGILTEDGKWTAVPLISQDDYPNIPYSQGSVASSGCGVTSMCMVASYVLGKFITPEDIAAYANKSAGDNVSRMTNAADYYGLEWTRSKNTSREDLVNYLNEGKLVICLVKGSSHFVVCTGINENGQIEVNDPYTRYRKDSHKDGYTWDELSFSAGNTWVVDPAQSTGATAVSGTVSVSNKVLEKLQAVNPDGQYEATVGAETIVPQNNNVTLKQNQNTGTNQTQETNTTTTTEQTQTQETNTTTTTEQTTQTQQTTQSPDTGKVTYVTNTQDYSGSTSYSSGSSYTGGTSYSSGTSYGSSDTSSIETTTTTQTESSNIITAPLPKRIHKTTLSELNKDMSSVLDKLKEDIPTKEEVELPPQKEDTSTKVESTITPTPEQSTSDYINSTLKPNIDNTTTENIVVQTSKPNNTISTTVKVPNTRVDDFDTIKTTPVEQKTITPHSALFTGTVGATIAAVTAKIGSTLNTDKNNKKDKKKDL